MSQIIEVVCIGAGSIIEVKAVFEFKARFQTGTEIFHTTKTETAFNVTAHADIGTGFLDQAGIDNTVKSDV